MHYELVIIGATAVALGLAKTVKKSWNTLILNKTEMVTYEFVNTYKMPSVYSEGAVYYKEFGELGVDILLETDIIDIKKENSKYNIEIFNNAGFQTIETKNIVDTTIGPDIKVVKKSLNCLLVNRNGEKFPNIEFDNVMFMNDRNEKCNTVIMKYDCGIEISINEARHRLIDFWGKRPEVLYDWKIATIGFCFEEIPEVGYSKKDENYILTPSAFFDSPTVSFDAGAELGRSMVL